MTPIGHFMCASAVAGNVDLLERRETVFCFGYYFLFLTVFAIFAIFTPPGKWAMYLHDQAGNLALLFFLIFWSRKDEAKQSFVCLLIGGQILAAYTHLFDWFSLKLLGEIPVGMWRPHNILHTPLMALIVSAVAAPIVGLLVKGLGYKRTFFFLLIGYLLHIFVDSITYDFGLYLLWPFDSFKISVISFFQSPDAASGFLGNPLYVFEESTVENIDGFIVYKAEVFVNLVLATLFFLKCLVKNFLKGI